MSSKTLNLPAVVPFPPTGIIEKLEKDEWCACCNTWKSILKYYLSLSDPQFSEAIAFSSSFVKFLESYLHAFLANTPATKCFLSSASDKINDDVFLTIERLFLGTAKPPEVLLTCKFFGTFVLAYQRRVTTSLILDKAWSVGSTLLKPATQSQINTIISHLESTKSSEADVKLVPKYFLSFLKSCSPAAEIIVTGSDLIDTIAISYHDLSASLQSSCTVLVYLGLVQLIEREKPNLSLLSDHLYSLKSDADKKKSTHPSQPTLLSSIVTNTLLVSKIRSKESGSIASRARSLVVALENYNDPGSKLRRHIGDKHLKGSKRTKDEKKAKDLHMHRAELMTQVQDLFPDLGSAFIVKLLGYFNDDVEQVIAHLLDNDLPDSLRDLDKSEILLPSNAAASNDLAPGLVPRGTPQPSDQSGTPGNIPRRHNVYDNDEFDRLAVSASQIHIGRKNATDTADSLLSSASIKSSSRVAQKAAILSALAAFDADDDERDDTYDLDDVGGTIDASTTDVDVEQASNRKADHETILLKALQSESEVFDRSAVTRRGKARQNLRERTGLNDEVIEGWAIMMRKEPAKLRKLEARYIDQTGSNQPNLQSTKWSPDSGQVTEDSEISGEEDPSRVKSGESSRGRQGQGGRGRGRGQNGQDPSTAHSRQKKETNKGSRANHNRRNQRAKKVARAGFPG